MATTSRGGWARRGQGAHAADEWVKEAACAFAQAAPMPMGAGNRAPMRDLKGWLARLLAEDVLPRWVDAAATLSQFNAANRKKNAETFTRTVLRTVSDRDHTRSQSVDTTLRRHCCTDLHKGLTFMKIFNVVFAAYDFTRSTSRCEQDTEQVVTASVAEHWNFRFEDLISSFRAVRLCVKNDDASKELISSVTNKTWAKTFSSLLLKETHSVCSVEPATSFDNMCTYTRHGGWAERRDLAKAIANAVISAAPNSITPERVCRSHFTPTLENDPICCAAMLMPHSPDFALTLADKVVGLSRSTLNSPIPFEIHREIRLFSHMRRIDASVPVLRQVMVAFAPVFKCNKPPLRWRPTDQEIQTLNYLASSDHWIALTVTALIDEDEGLKRNCPRKNYDALTRYQMSGECGDVFGATHAAQMLVEGSVGVRRNPLRAEQFLKYAAKYKLRPAISLLADLYCGGAGEPEVPKNENEAARLYQVASDMGCYRATNGLAKMYQRGAGGLAKDPEKCDELLKLVVLQKEEKLKRKRGLLQLQAPLRSVKSEPNISAGQASSTESRVHRSSSEPLAIAAVSAPLPVPAVIPPSVDDAAINVPDVEPFLSDPGPFSSQPDPLVCMQDGSDTFPPAAANVVHQSFAADPYLHAGSGSSTCALPVHDALTAQTEQAMFAQTSRLRLVSDLDRDDGGAGFQVKRRRYQPIGL